MKLSELKKEWKNKLPKWEIEVDDEIIKFSIVSWREETQIDYWDIESIRDEFCNGSFKLITKLRYWENNNIGIDHIIQIKHNIKFEREEWEKYL